MAFDKFNSGMKGQLLA
jgi:hypothetical protein